MIRQNAVLVSVRLFFLVVWSKTVWKKRAVKLENNDNKSYLNKEVSDCIATLEKMIEQPEIFAGLSENHRIALMSAAGKISRPDLNDIRRRNREVKRNRRREIVEHEKKARAATGIRVARESSVFAAPERIDFLPENSNRISIGSETPELKSPRNCYVCKKEFTRLHHFYDSMCPECGEFNYQKRFQTAPLDGKTALITGSRVKIGYQSGLMLLRAGARVIATTRFPVDSAFRYSREADYNDWKDRLHIYGLDLRHTPSVEIFSSHIEQTFDRLDILVNNAAQTVRRPPGFYAHLMGNETRDPGTIPENTRNLLLHHYECVNRLNTFFVNSADAESALPVTWNGKSPGIGLRASAALSQIPYIHDHSILPEEVFPEGRLDADLQQVDLRDTNSWRLKLGEIQTAEMLEVHLVNAVAPFVLCNRLASMMKRDYTGQKHIVNVTAMEGKFFRFKSTGRHPHTNMAKAALNMLTHTSAAELAKSGIYMNAVDTGWVTDEDPAKLSAIKQELHDFQPPLDIVDGAARVCDPFFDGILTGQHWCGKFLKDYRPIDW